MSVGLSGKKVIEVTGELFDDVAEGRRKVYTKLYGYCSQWTPERSIPDSALETLHIRVYLNLLRGDRGLSKSYLGCVAAAIQEALAWHSQDHRIDWEEVAEQLRVYRRQDRQQPAGADPISPVSTLSCWRPPPGFPGRTSGRRRPPAAATWGGLRHRHQPGHVYGVLKIPFSKTDQVGNGEDNYVHISSLARLQEMTVCCGWDPSRPEQLIFGLGDRQISNRISAACEHAGLVGKF